MLEVNLKELAVFYWLMKHVALGPLMRLMFRPRVLGAENVPTEGPVIFASNHVSFIDSIVLPIVVSRPLAFLAKSEYFTGKGLKGWFVRQFFNAAGQIPMDRSGGKASEASLNTGLEVLREGGILGIYPEGTRSPDGKLYRGRTGVARLVLDAHVPVVPVFMRGTRDAMPLGAKLPRPKKVTVTFGEPMSFERFSGLEGERFVLRAVTDELVNAIRIIGNEEYVDAYASTVRAARART